MTKAEMSRIQNRRIYNRRRLAKLRKRIAELESIVRRRNGDKLALASVTDNRDYLAGRVVELAAEVAGLKLTCEKLRGTIARHELLAGRIPSIGAPNG